MAPATFFYTMENGTVFKYTGEPQVSLESLSTEAAIFQNIIVLEQVI